MGTTWEQIGHSDAITRVTSFIACHARIVAFDCLALSRSWRECLLYLPDVVAPVLFGDPSVFRPPLQGFGADVVHHGCRFGV